MVITDPEWLRTAGPQLRQIYTYWRDRCRDGRPPRRTDIDPIDIPRLLSRLIIVDVVPDARRFVYRLVGTKEVEVRGFDPTGKSVAEGFIGPTREDALGWYELTVKTLQPQYDARPYVSTNGKWINDETLFLPLSDDGVTANRVLVFASNSPNNRKRG
ncbi:MAG: PAS domain-containing protein [Rhodospirillaceae bacterium]|nr:PAS domain-containing protein [Rhodospirillaceae bacterium]